MKPTVLFIPFIGSPMSIDKRDVIVLFDLMSHTPAS